MSDLVVIFLSSIVVLISNRWFLSCATIAFSERCKGKTVCAPWRHMGEWNATPLFLHLCSRWKWVDRLTPKLLYCRRGKSLGTHWMGSVWVSKDGLDTFQKRKISPPANNLITVSRPGVQSIPSSLSFSLSLSFSHSFILSLSVSHFSKHGLFWHDSRPWDLSSRSKVFNIQYVVLEEREVDAYCPEQ